MKRLLTIVIVLQVVQLWGQWTGGSYVSTAQAQIPDAGAIRLQILDETRNTNSKLDKLIDLFSSGHAQVSVVDSKK